MSVFMSFFLGLVQGIAEFLPISSSGHLSIFQNLLSMDYAEAEHLFFDVLLHFGTLVAVCIAYRKDLKSMFRGTASLVRGRRGAEYAGYDEYDSGRLSPSMRTLFLIIVGTLPLFLLVPFYSSIEQLYYNTPFIGFALIITGTLLYVSDKLSEGKKTAKTFTVFDALIIGFSQAIAIIPGLSRSGTTITVATARGLKREFAVKFSFLLSIPAILGSCILTFFKAIKQGIDWSLLPTYLVGVIIATVVGLLAIRFVNYLVSKTKFGKFCYYCWGVGVLTIFLSIIL